MGVSAATSDGSFDLLRHLPARLLLDAPRRVLVKVLIHTRQRRSGADTIRVVNHDVDPCAWLGQPALVAMAGVPLMAVPGVAGTHFVGGPGLVVPGVLLALALVALLSPLALTSPPGRRRRHLRRLLLQSRRHWRVAAARRREAALKRRAGPWWALGGSNLDELKARITDAFDPVQSRWQAPADSLRGYVSQAFYDRHRRELQRLEAHHQTRRIVVSSFEGVEIVAFAASGEFVRVVAHVRFSAYETLSDRRNARVIEGVPGKRRVCRECWTLVLHPEQGWVVDDIERRPRGRAVVELAPPVAVRVARGATGALKRVALWFEQRRLRPLAAPRARGAPKHGQPSPAAPRRSSADEPAAIAWTGANTGASTPRAYVDGDRARRPDQQVERRPGRRR